MKKFQSGKIVTGDYFKGRKKIVSEVESYLSMDQSVVLIAPRRYGKSSIIQKVVDDNKHNFKIISLDLQYIQNKRLLAEQIISKTYAAVGYYGIVEQLKSGGMDVLSKIVNFLASIKLTIGDVTVEFTEKLIKDNDDDSFLRHALELPGIFAEKTAKRFLFVIDEFGEITKLQTGNELIDTMRSIFQKQSNVVYLFAGSQYALMQDIFINKNSAFYKFSVPINVPTMKGTDFEELFRTVFYGNQISLPNNFADDIERISGGIPYYMIRIAQQVLIDAMFSKTINTHCFSIRRAAAKVFNREEGYFILELNKLKGKKYDMIALVAIAQGKKHSQILSNYGVARQNANKIVISLVLSGLVEKSSKYRISDPFFERFIRKNY